MSKRHAKLNDRQLALVIDMLKAGSVWLSRESAGDYIEAANFVFDHGLFFYPGVAAEELVAEQSRRTQPTPDHGAAG